MCTIFYLNYRCEVYTGNLCSAHVNSRKVFIKFGQTQQTTAKNIENIFRSMSSFMLPKCKSYLLPSLCKYYFPPCDAKRKKPKAIPICKKDCMYLEQNACQSVYSTVKAVSSSLRYQLPTCSNLPTADAENAPTNCQRIFSSSECLVFIFRDVAIVLFDLFAAYLALKMQFCSPNLFFWEKSRHVLVFVAGSIIFLTCHWQTCIIS